MMRKILTVRNKLSKFKLIHNQPLQDVLEKWKQRFEVENVPEINASINNILAHVLEKRKITEDENFILNSTQIKKFESLCECRIARMPIQYIIGQWEFCDLTLKMSPPVFIPRPETEELVELILQQVDEKDYFDFLEIGCGTGAISLALLQSLPKSTSVAIDQSKLACNLTIQNAKMLNLDSRLKVLNEKLTLNNQLDEIDESFDLIVSNPPYVKTNDLLNLEPEIKLYEDLRALDGGEDGLNVIKCILHLSSKKLKQNGHLWLEIDPGQPKFIEDYLNEHSAKLKLRFVSSYQDLFKKDRFVEIVKL